jgi:hypothetical protein
MPRKEFPETSGFSLVIGALGKTIYIYKSF